ncbi:hypothetical protein [Microvirga alba]|uniref:hypothetical protein n=1 Tax=Microvirga alba TaxID=2791025 RepID=UPI001AEEE85B|nr:hypothetical protein [Microvirga alba]
MIHNPVVRIGRSLEKPHSSRMIPSLATEAFEFEASWAEGLLLLGGELARSQPVDGATLQPKNRILRLGQM